MSRIVMVLWRVCGVGRVGMVEMEKVRGEE